MPNRPRSRGVLPGCLLIAFCLNAALLQAQVNLTVAGADGLAVGGYRWLVEEDKTYHVAPGVVKPGPTDPKPPLALGFYTSYMPVVAKGTAPAGGPTTISGLNPAKHYYVSVLPTTAGTYTLGGAQIPAGATSVTVYLNRLPLPTAQISIRVFRDNAPVNGQFDTGEEPLKGFSVLVEDAGGRYGASAGQATQDAYGNPFGTQYQKDANGDFIVDPVTKEPQVLLDASGKPVVIPPVTDATGELTLKHLSPGKYGISVVPPPGFNWQQTTTIEGTKIIDAWVKANEPPYFAEFGPPGPHVEFGFVQPMNVVSNPATGTATIKGQIVNNHMSRPPNYAFYNGAPYTHTTPWVGLNSNGGVPGTSEAVFVARTFGEGNFEIPNVPAGTYQLAVWDDALDIIFASYTITVNANGTCNNNASCDLADVPVFQWFSRQLHYVFHDDGCGNEKNANNGFREDCEKGIPEQVVNLRWRDGTLYQSALTDLDGFVPFDQVFPFFAWQVAEVDYARYKATGVSVTVDEGGPITKPSTGTDWTFGAQLNPQPQAENLNKEWRTERGPVLTQAFQGFIGQTSAFAWGKRAYTATENGGISGVVYYDTTRAEDDPMLNLAEVWQPGIPNVEVRLWNKAGTMLHNKTFTDSWDANLPENCQGAPFEFIYNPALPPYKTDCYDGLRVFNQVRPGVFDGGYAFTTYFVNLQNQPVPFGTSGAREVRLPAGEYVVEVVPPKGINNQRTYEVVKEEDKNVDFGDNYTANNQAMPPVCVGLRSDLGYTPQVPAYLTLFPGISAPHANEVRPLCNKKRVVLNNSANAAADFFLFTEVPVAGHIYGMILDDTANEFDPNSPHFGEKFAPSWVPVSVRDHTGREISRTYADQFGLFNALVPSTHTMNRPFPSGAAPSMITTCMNARVIPGVGNDPYHNPQYSEFCYNFQYMPGTTTHLDTPVVPVAAASGPNQSQLDCEFPDGTPRIKQVSTNTTGLSYPGPYVPVANGTWTMTIQSVGTVKVPNPFYCPGPPLATNCTTVDIVKFIDRNYDFGGTPGTLLLKANAGGAVFPLPHSSWTAAQIQASIPQGLTAGTYQLIVTKADGKQSKTGITLTVGPLPRQPIVVNPGGSIQSAIDGAQPGDLILVAPGTYSEMVIMWKPVQLQGAGEGSTIIDAVRIPTEKLNNWRLKLFKDTLPNLGLVPSGQVTLVPGQEVALFGLQSEEGAGIFVIGQKLATDSSNLTRTFAGNPSRIDGLSVTGSDTGGGIVLNGYNDKLVISNNRVSNNNGFYAGGIRVGHPDLLTQVGEAELHSVAPNPDVVIRNNKITTNGGEGGAGGGVSVCNGADRYKITENWICGNFTLGDGGGIGHLGVNNGGEISKNTIVFNESFIQGASVSGGGIFVGGQAPLAANTLSDGSGNVNIDGNLIQGNNAGAGDGGGIRLSLINGRDLATNPVTAYKVNVTNNIIVNNIAGMAGGGVSLQDAVKVNIWHNTIARNDSTATAGAAFAPGSPNESMPQGAGIVSWRHGPDLTALLGPGTYSNPSMGNNVVLQNRSFNFLVDKTVYPPVHKLVPAPATPVFRDFAVQGMPGVPPTLTCTNCVVNPVGLTAGFVRPYYNGHAGQTVLQGEATTAITVPAAFDEGGNWIKVRFGPLTLFPKESPAGPLVMSDYHLNDLATFDMGAPFGALDPALAALLAKDFDAQARPQGAGPDPGADEKK